MIPNIELVKYEESPEVPAITLENLTLSRKNVRSICTRSYFTCLADRKWFAYGLDFNIVNCDLEYVQ